MSLIFICDIDCTVADTTHRIDTIMNKIDNKCWGEREIKEFSRPELIKMDKLISKSKQLSELVRRCNAKLIFLTARSEMARNPTRAWLKDKLNISNSVPLLMRDENDFSDAEICKKKIFTNTILNMHPECSFIFFDDNEQVLKMYSEFGLALKAPECWDNIIFF